MISQVNERHSVPLFASNDSVAGSHIRKINLQKTGHVYINKHMEHVSKWIEQQAVNAKYFVTLNFAFDVSREQMEKAARAFQNRVSQAIASNDARKGRYTHHMVNL